MSIAVPRRLIQRAALIALAVTLLAGCGSGNDNGRDPIRVQAITVDGSSVVYDDLAAQDTVLWFWAPW